MSLQRQMIFWVGALAAFILALVVLRPILLPFVAGMALAYALDPLADRLERLGLGRLAASLVILVLFTVVFIVAIAALAPLLAQQIALFAQSLPANMERLQDLFQKAGQSAQMSWLRELMGTSESGGPAGFSAGGLVGQAAAWLAGVAQSLLSGGLALVNFLSLLVVTPVVAFYLLNDWDRMIARIDSWLPRDHVDTIRELARQVDSALAGFVRGQGLLCLILGLFYAIGLSLVGLNFGLLIGLGAGLISFIPFVGTILGFVVSVGVALAQFWPDWVMIGAVIAIFVVGQMLEGNVLQPKLVGEHVGLHPVWLIFALFAFGYLFGFVGMLLAVPLAAVVGVLSRFAVRQYLHSRYYTGSGGDPGLPPA